jgi:hypothetical protein
VEREDSSVAIPEEGSDEDAAQADDSVRPAASDEAAQVDERNDVDEPAVNEAEGLGAARPAGDAAATEAPPAAEPVATAEPVSAAEPVATADPVAAAEPVATAKPVATADPVATAKPVAAAEPPATEQPVAPAGGAGSGSWIRTIAGGARRSPWQIAAAAAVAAVVAIVLVVVTANSAAVASPKARKRKPEPVRVVSVSPGNGSTGVNGTSPVTVTYSGRLTSHTPLPTLSPSIAGSWQVSGDQATFTPQVGFTEDTSVTVNVPAPAGTTTTAATSVSFTTGQYSVLRLDELLSQLGYIPLTFTPAEPSGDVPDIPAADPGAQLAAAYDPPSGSFSFDSGYPSALTSMWSVGTNNEIIDGAVRTFEFDQGLNMDGQAGPQVWSHLFTAIAKGQQNQHGYTYVWVTQAGTETLDLYHNGQLAITSPVNTGIAASPTVDGTFPVYLRYQVTQMQGTNPDGTPYDDTVYWVSYFNGGDAVHAFPRGSYGWYQSLGCVELPSYGSVAENAWNLITYGTLVTVTGPVA